MDKLFGSMFAIMVIVWLSVVGAIGYVAVHFLSKVW